MTEEAKSVATPDVGLQVRPVKTILVSSTVDVSLESSTSLTVMVLEVLSIAPLYQMPPASTSKEVISA